MVFKNFRLNIVFRIILLVAALAGFAWAVVRSKPIQAVYLGILIVLLALEFFYYTDRLNRDLNQFFLSILNDDYSSVFQDRGRGRSFHELYGTMDAISRKLNALGKEKEIRGQYLFSLIDQVRVGIISFETGGRVNLVNEAFRQMLNIRTLSNGSDLSEQEPEIYSILAELEPGERKLLRRRVQGEDREFSIIASKFKMEDTLYHLISLQDIREELDRRELEAWQKLIRVLTHEIMNSVSPISSLTGSLHELVSKAGPDTDGSMLRERLGAGLSAIRERSMGLMKFTEDYQHLSRIPAPTISEIRTTEFVGRIRTLFDAECRSKGISFRVGAQDAPGTFRADMDLMEQVVINLIRNASDAVENRSGATIGMEIRSREDGRVSIVVGDNGSGIPEDLVDRIFVPFFSTKEKGSGIGLSLSRQIVLMHGGRMRVDSQEGEGSRFEILL